VNFAAETERLRLIARLTDGAPPASRLHRVGAALQGAVALKLAPGPVEQGIRPGWGSRFGGAPYSPAGFVWPQKPDGSQMAFVGQLDLSQLDSSKWPIEFTFDLPREGILQLYFGELHTVGPRPDAGFRVVWSPAPDAPHVPQVGPEAGRVASALRFEPCWSAPGLTALLPELWPLDLATHDEYRRWLSEDEGWARSGYDALSSATTEAHQLLGHAWETQYDPRWTMVLREDPAHSAALDDWTAWSKAAIDALPWDDAGRVTDAQLASVWEGWLAQSAPGRALEAARAKWRLLWQIDTDERLGLQWGDLGRLYVMIRDADLAAGALDRVRVEWQGH
jgi:hypothetical protein